MNVKFYFLGLLNRGGAGRSNEQCPVDFDSWDQKMLLFEFVGFPEFRPENRRKEENFPPGTTESAGLLN